MSSDSLGPEDLKALIGAQSRPNVERLIQNSRQSRDSGSNSQQPDIADSAAQHDSAIRNHLAGLVRSLVQRGESQKLHDLLIEHRNFIDGILDLLTNPK